MTLVTVRYASTLVNLVASGMSLPPGKLPVALGQRGLISLQ